MRRLLGICLVLWGLCVVAGRPAAGAPAASSCHQADSLDVMLSEYFKALEYESLDVQKSECDFLIETCSDSLVRQDVATRVYTHYLNSPVMGMEAVAIHVFDKWFATGKVRMKDESAYFGAGIYAEFNRRSLIGMPAQPLSMSDMDGKSVELYAGIPGRYSVLYFYDTDCPKCLLETSGMPELVKEDFPVDINAVYVGGDSLAWNGYRTRFCPEGLVPEHTVLRHLWDPEVSSDFQRKYGVIQTPRIFLIDDMGMIRGRGLDVRTLSMMLHDVFDGQRLEYGSEKSMALFTEIFEPYGEVREKEIREVADYIAGKTLEKADTVMFRQLAGDMLYYLIPQKGEGVKSGIRYLLDEYILGRGDIWKSEDDSLKVIGSAMMMDELLSMTPVGSRVPALTVPGVRRRGKRVRTGEFDISALGGKRNFIMFVTPGCEVCRAEKEAVDKYMKNGYGKGFTVLEIDMDETMLTSPELADRLFGIFDLTSLPMIIETGPKGKVRRKYISLTDEKIWKDSMK